MIDQSTHLTPSRPRQRWVSSLFATRLTGAVAGVIAMTAAVAANSAELRVTVDGIRSDQGKIMAALHTSKSGVAFPDGAGTVAAQWRVAQAGKIQFVFSDLPSGRFAIAVFHDENGNDSLDTNLLGIPKEGYAFSENARGFAGPPSFDAASVEVADGAIKSTAATLGY